MKKAIAILLICASVLSGVITSSAKSRLLEVGTVEIKEPEHYLTHEETSKIVNESAKAEMEAIKNGTYKPQFAFGEKSDNGTRKSGTLRDYFSEIR